MQDEKTDSAPITVDDIDSAPDNANLGAGDTLVSIEDYQNAFARVGLEKDLLQAELD